jgi:hypothetical protein
MTGSGTTRTIPVGTGSPARHGEPARCTMLKSELHRATVTQADLHYVGSLTLDRDLMDAENNRVARASLGAPRRSGLSLGTRRATFTHTAQAVSGRSVGPRRAHRDQGRALMHGR